MPAFSITDEPNEQQLDDRARFTVFGVGGGGGNAVEHMIRSGVSGVDFVCANTDLQALKSLSAPTLIHLDTGKNRGLGAGANPDVGRAAAENSSEEISKALEGADMVYIAAGMGGGTGTGGAPVVAKIAKDLGILTVAVVTTPLHFEQKKRMNVAKAGIEELMKHVDSIIVIPNEKLKRVFGTLNLRDAYAKADDVLLNAVTGITDIVTETGYVNTDFEDIRTCMKNRGYAMMGVGRASGEDRHIKAADMAIHSPLLDDVVLENAGGLVVNISAGEELNMIDMESIVEFVSQIAERDTGDVIFGAVIDPSLADEVRVTVVATGLTREEGLGLEDAGGGQQPKSAFARQQQSVGSRSRQIPTLDKVHDRAEPKRTSVQTSKVMDYLKRETNKD